MAFKGLDFYRVDDLLTDEERMVRDTVRRFVDEKVLPIIDKHFEDATFPKELIPQAVNSAVDAAAPGTGAAIENPQSRDVKLGSAISPDPALVEEVVQRVLDKMRPQVVDIITKEFLRPIVQALVTREIEKH